MTPVVKAGIIGGLSTSVVVPVALTGSAGAKSVGLLDLDSLEKVEVEKQTTKKSALDSFTKAGYRKKNESELIDFSKNRDTDFGGNFALGCHRLLFEGKNVPRLSDNENTISVIWSGDPMGDYLGKDKSRAVLGCSTASIMKWGSDNTYEFELAVRRGDVGFLERITVWKNKTAVSQLVVYTKVQNPDNRKQHSWFNWYGIQRKLTNVKDFEIGNPKDGTWGDLRIENSSKNNPNYFTVWIEDKQGVSNDKSMLKGLGIKTKPDSKLFSSIAKTNNQDNWHFNFFGIRSQRWPISVNTNATGKNYATYNSKIAEDVEGFRGIWQDVTEFCKSQKGRENEDLPHADAERLRDYCYTNKPITSKNK